MFKLHHFVIATATAICFVVLDLEHAPPHVLLRQQAAADASALADALQAEKEWVASQDASVTVCLHPGAC